MVGKGTYKPLLSSFRCCCLNKLIVLEIGTIPTTKVLKKSYKEYLKIHILNVLKEYMSLSDHNFMINSVEVVWNTLKKTAVGKVLPVFSCL